MGTSIWPRILRGWNDPSRDSLNAKILKGEITMTDDLKTLNDIKASLGIGFGANTKLFKEEMTLEYTRREVIKWIKAIEKFVHIAVEWEKKYTGMIAYEPEWCGVEYCPTCNKLYYPIKETHYQVEHDEHTTLNIRELNDSIPLLKYINNLTESDLK